MSTQYETRLFINGEYTLPVEANTFELFSAATEEKVADIHIAGQQDIDRAVAAAKAAQPAWGDLPGAQRAAKLVKLAELLERDGDKVAAVCGLELRETERRADALSLLPPVTCILLPPCSCDIQPSRPRPLA